MAAVNPLGAIPTGTFPLRLAPGIGENAGEGSKKRKRQSDNVVGLRYNFKPASITPDTPGGIHTEHGSRLLKFDMASGGQQVFDLREEVAKPRECVLIWDGDTQSFTLHPLSSTLQLTLNRSASSSTSTGPSSIPFSASSTLSASNSRHHPRPPSTSSSTSSTAIPLSGNPASASTDDRKRSRPSLEPSAGASKGGKTLPRKQPLPSTSVSSGPKGTSTTSAKPRPKPKYKPSAAGKSKGKATIKGEDSKIKSSEIIEDSDEEAAGYDIPSTTGHEEEEDEFAMLVGQSLAGGLDEDEDEDGEEEEDDEDDEGEDEDEALGGAKVVLDADGSEWV